ncbi:Golgi transport complex subunit 5-domain-containing protein [Naematelia encephala]|uniref:Conserved oligomeric Golgi complex subunit 5 n=1 Tax=Naematelia encephala TaxID=71784 RepID=A0A1Y2AKW0_9TREE|nr:Golgi transport complex subunit 5-domain-containing protein [Naematelia encephala]
MTETYIDHTPFLSDKFDVHAYANAALSGQVYDPDAEDGPTVNGGSKVVVGSSSRRIDNEKGDVGVELARLSYGIEDVTRQLRQEIASSHPLLLTHLTTSLSLTSHLNPIRTSLTSLSTSLDRLHTKIHNPYVHLQILVRRLTLLGQASDLARRAARFVLVSRRLESQMEKIRNTTAGKDAGEGERERELAKAALSVAELDTLLKATLDDDEERYEGQLEPLPLQSLDFIQAYIPVVDKARDGVIQEMESMVVNGLADLNQPLLSSSLQTAHNLRLLPDLVSNLLADLNDAVTLRVQKAFDSAAIGREVAQKDTNTSHSAIKFVSRSKTTEPNASNQQQWIAVLWSRLERVIEDVANCCIKVYTLEKVLKMKRDPTTGVEFLDEVMKTLDEKPSFMFWTTLAQAFEKQTKEAARSSAWLQQALSTGYPRLLRLFHDFFAKIAVHTDTVYTREHQSPEAVLVLRSVSVFETLYLSRSTSRMTEAVSGALSMLSGRGNLPGPAEGVTIARTVTNELDSAKFDPLLVRTVARNAVRVLENLTSRLDAALVKDFTATSLIGPQATPAQVTNAQLVGCLYHAQYNMSFIREEFPGKVWEIIQPCLALIENTYKRITDALDTVLRRDVSSIIARLHKVDFSKPVDPMSMASAGGGGGSPYMRDLIDKLGFLKSEILGRMSLGEFMREWILDLCRYMIKIFLLHASIARPMGESGRLKLTGDLTEFEMGLASLLGTGQVQGGRGIRLERVGDEYLALRAFRSLLFADPVQLANPVETVHLPPLIVLHNLVVSSPLLLPHQVHGWTETEYVLWCLNHQDEREQWALLEKAVEDQLVKNPTKQNGQNGKHQDGEIEAEAQAQGQEEKWVGLIREVLIHARHDDTTPAGA